VSGQNDPTIDAGFYLPASLGDYVWDDKNANGVQDSGEAGIGGVIVKLTGTDGAGNAVSTTTTTSATGAYTFTNLAPGTYVVTFTKPAGYVATTVDLGGNDAADSDANTITGVAPSVTLISGDNNTTIDAGYYKPATLGDYVWEDKNANGIQETGELGVSGVTVKLTGTDGFGNPVSQTKVTGTNGDYLFTNLIPGSYTVTFEKPVGYSLSPADSGINDAKDSDANTAGIVTPIILSSGDNNTTIDAGIYKPASLGDYVWEDTNANGQQDLSEPIIANVAVSLLDASGNHALDNDGNPVSATTTNASGFYNFGNLKPGVSYVVKFTAPAGYVQTLSNIGADASDSDALPVSGISTAVILSSGENNPTIDAGYYKPASIGDFVWVDNNANGVQDSGELGLQGVTVSLSGNTTAGTPVSLITTTGANGEYLFANLAPGNYTVVFTKPDSYNSSLSDQGGNDTKDSDANPITGISPTIPLLSGDVVTTIDAGYYKLASLGDYVWLDKNANGLQESNEVGIPNVNVSLTGTNALGANISLTTTTNSNGGYSFTNLVPGNYFVTFTKPLGYVASPANIGSNDAIDSDANILNGITSSITLTSGENNPTIDAGYYLPVSLGDFVWEDKNANGIQEANEPGIPSVIVTLTGTDGAGNPVTTTTSTGSLGEYAFTNLVPGTYTVTFAKPVGFVPTSADKGLDTKDSDANISSGAAPSVTLISGENNPTIDAGFYKPASLGDLVWEDKNGNGVQDSDEPGVAGVTVTLTGTDGAGNPVSLTLITGPNGEYLFTGLAPGTYTVAFTNPAGYVFTPNDKGGNDATDSDANALGVTPAITLGSGDNITTVDAGLVKPASLGNFVWNDKNANGIQDVNEIGISNVTVTLNGTDGAGNIVTATTTTGTNGEYLFSNLAPGSYSVTFTKPVGFTASPADLGGNDATDSDANKTTGITPAVVLKSGDVNTTLDAGFFELAKIGDFVWEDKNANGIQDAGEPGLAGVVVSISGTDTQGNIVNATQTTGPDGTYMFTDLLPGNYTIIFSKPNNYVISTSDAGGNDSKDSDANPLNGIAPTVVLVGGDNITTIDAGMYLPVSIGNYVWNDLNINGVQDLTEQGIPGASVTLNGTKGDGTVIAPITIQTDSNGAYLFSNLAPGTYTVSFTTPVGYPSPSPSNVGNDAKDSDPINGQTSPITLQSGGSDLTIDAGFYLPASIGNFVWDDKNANGIQDAGEPGIAGVTVTLTSGTTTVTTTTDANGAYSFINLVPGTYSVSFTNPLNYEPSFVNVGSNDEVDSDGPLVNNIVIVPGTNNQTIDAGFIATDCDLQIGGIIYIDNSGVADGVNGTPINGPKLGVYMTMLKDGAIYRVTPIDANGLYRFYNVPVGIYNLVMSTTLAGSVDVQLPAGYKTVSEGGDVSGTLNGEDTNGLSGGDGTQTSETTIIVTCQKIIYEMKERSFPELPGHPYRPHRNNGLGNGRVAAGPATYLENDFGITQVTALPVTLVSFTGKATDEVVNLTWKTSNEQNFNHFEVERSSDSKEFGSIGTVEANTSNIYSLQDRNPMSGINYYRLRMVDNDGSYTHSKVISVNFNKNESFVTVENPAVNGEFMVMTDLVNPTFNLLSTIGSNIETKVVSVDKNKFMVRVPNYISGTYFLTITSNGKLVTKKILIP
jgi:SdrD B-like domain